IMNKIICDEPVPPRRLDRTIPVDLETIVLKCLEKDPERRYQSAQELADDLQAWLDGEPIVARSASLPYLVAKRLRKHRALASAAGGGGLGGLGLEPAARRKRARRAGAGAGPGGDAARGDDSHGGAPAAARHARRAQEPGGEPLGVGGARRQARTAGAGAGPL